jgi:hypothetical protein
MAAMEAEYEERYCAFIDILGFGELIGKLQYGGTPLHTYASCFLRFIILRRPTPALSLGPTFAPRAYPMP